MGQLWRLPVLLAVLLLPCAALAEAYSLFARSDLSGARPGLSGARASLIAPRDATGPPAAGGDGAGDGAPAADRRLASLFVGQGTGGLFAQLPDRTAYAIAPARLPRGGTAEARIRDLIAEAEAGRAGYDAVVWSARIKTPKPPTRMTIGEIYDWIAATPNQNHAIGRYQFIPATLRRLVRDLGLNRGTQFSPQVQDALADLLLEEAGLSRIHAGQISRRQFMTNLAKIWAGLPTPSGRSYYHGYAGNRATVSAARFDAELRALFPG